VSVGGEYGARALSAASVEAVMVGSAVPRALERVVLRSIRDRYDAFRGYESHSIRRPVGFPAGGQFPDGAEKTQSRRLVRPL
jgi:hypothetical protein